jgi:hypothetical protein
LFQSSGMVLPLPNLVVAGEAALPQENGGYSSVGAVAVYFRYPTLAQVQKTITLPLTGVIFETAP